MIHIGTKVPLLIALLFLATQSCIGRLPQPTTTVTPSLASTQTTVPISTRAPSATRIPFLTSTFTPPPEWVSTFAQPILDAIADRPPDVDENFSYPNRISAWERFRSGVFETSRIEIRDGEFYVTNSDVYRDLFFYDFVLMLDGRFVSEQGRFVIAYRDELGVMIEVSVQPDQLAVYNSILSTGYIFETTASLANKPIHIMFIIRGKAIALYIDGQPLYYGTSSIPLYGQIYIRTIPDVDEWASVFTVAFDNLKIWELSGLSIP